MSCPELVEIKDGLLSSEDKEIMKARSVDLFPENVQSYFKDKTKINRCVPEPGIDRVTVICVDRTAVFDFELFEYTRKLGEMDYYLSNIPLPCEDKSLYPLLAKYPYGWCILAPLEV